MLIFVVAFFHMCLTDFSMGASLPGDEDISDDGCDFVIDKAYLISDNAAKDGLASTICRLLGLFKATLRNYKKTNRTLKENPNDDNLPEINEPKDFDKQCLELVSYVTKTSNSTGTNLMDDLRMILTMRSMIADLKREVADFIAIARN